MLALPTGTVTFALTDVEHSTALWERHPAAMRAALARHDHLVEEHVKAHEGVLVRPRGEGDSRFAVFARATDALAAACDLQLALHRESWPPETPLRARIALHTGEADLREGDYYGSAVNRCARLRAIAHGGQVLVSASTEELVRDSLPLGASLLDLGEQRLRDLTRPERVYQLAHSALPADFPSPRSLDAYPHNLPIQVTSFVGREREIADVKRLIRTTRLLTLTGTGGCGKTRLALQVAAECLDEYPDGVWFVDLAPVSDPALVTQTLAQTLGVREQGSQPILSTLLSYLKLRRPLLLLDNCEHLIGAVASLVDALLHGCPQVSILATSREALSVSGEVPWRVPSLPSPRPEESASPFSLGQYEAVRLFVERAATLQPAFAVTRQNASAVAQVCWRLDGIPLAIELAAARVKVLTPEQIARRLDDRFRLLTGGSRTAVRRQQTLRAAIDWSYDLLSDPEKRLLRRLAVFVGGCTLEAAEEVCVGDGLEEDVILDLLAQLADKSLVAVEEASGEARYRLLETIRQYAQDRLLESGEAAAVRDRHRDWYVALSDRAWVGVREGPETDEWLEELLPAELDNLRVAMEWSRADSGRAAAGLRIAGNLMRFWSGHGYYVEGSRWLEEFLAAAPERTPQRAIALRAACALLIQRGLLGPGRRLIEESLAISQELGDELEASRAEAILGYVEAEAGEYGRARARVEKGVAWVRARGNLEGVRTRSGFLGVIAIAQRDYASARTAFEESLALSREAGGSKVYVGRSIWLLGLLDRLEGDFARARSRLEESAALLRDGAPETYRLALVGLGNLARAQGDFGKAREVLAEALAWRRGHHDSAAVAEVVCWLGVLAVAEGKPARGARLLGAGASVNPRFGSLYSSPDLRVDGEDSVATVRSVLGEEAFAKAWAEGQAMTLDEAVEYALAEEAADA